MMRKCKVRASVACADVLECRKAAHLGHEPESGTVEEHATFPAYCFGLLLPQD